MKGIIFLSLAVATLIIGIHQAMVHGITESYWVFMFAVCFLLLYRYVKKPEEGQDGAEDAQAKDDITANKESIAAEGKMARKMRRKKKKIG